LDDGIAALFKRVGFIFGMAGMGDVMRMFKGGKHIIFMIP